jgi:hypothetical protein
VAVGIKKLQAAFPACSPMYFNLLGERLAANGFTDQRFNDAIGNLLDTFKYPTPTISDVISWDKKIKLHTYSDVLAQMDKGFAFSDFAIYKKVGKKVFWILVSDAEKYNIKF